MAVETDEDREAAISLLRQCYDVDESDQEKHWSFLATRVGVEDCLRRTPWSVFPAALQWSHGILSSMMQQGEHFEAVVERVGRDNVYRQKLLSDWKRFASTRHLWAMPFVGWILRDERVKDFAIDGGTLKEKLKVILTVAPYFPQHDPFPFDDLMQTFTVSSDDNLMENLDIEHKRCEAREDRPELDRERMPRSAEEQSEKSIWNEDH